ncbi:unnamed protein product [Thlaspi arvense]|uniref:Uncharacterized protein n=1 Tax=Thlaspi arvense TaxID=13288 RepID=A0AAU9R4E7_THLAR|nr:unnamed protein product [Thlaspi arvense]
MSPWTEILTNASMFVIIQALAFLIISTSSEIFSYKKKTKRTFGRKLSTTSIGISHLLALISDDVSQAEEEVEEDEASSI